MHPFNLGFYLSEPVLNSIVIHESVQSLGCYSRGGAKRQSFLETGAVVALFTVP